MWVINFVAGEILGMPMGTIGGFESHSEAAQWLSTNGFSEYERSDRVVWALYGERSVKIGDQKPIRVRRLFAMSFEMVEAIGFRAEKIVDEERSSRERAARPRR